MFPTRSAWRCRRRCWTPSRTSVSCTRNARVSTIAAGRTEYHLKAYHASAYLRSGATYDNLFDGSVPVTRIKPAGGATRWGAGWRSRRIYAGNAFDRYLVDVFVLAVSSMIRRSLVIAAGPQNPRFGFFHDREFILRLCRMSRVAFIDLPLYRIRYHAEQVSTTGGRRAGYILIRKQQDLLRVLRVHGVRDRGYYRARHAIIDRQLVRLCRAAAIALLSFHRGSAHQLRSFPLRRDGLSGRGEEARQGFPSAADRGAPAAAAAAPADEV